MEQNNLDIYGSEPIPWSRPLEQLKAFQAGPGTSIWLSTSSPDGRPHTAGVGAVWLDDRFYFTSGPRMRKSRNLAANPRCAVSVSLADIDVVVEGTAKKVSDMKTLERVVKVYVSLGWPAEAADGAITAPFSAPSAGRGPWDLYALTATTAVGVATKEPHGATRWHFDR